MSGDLLSSTSFVNKEVVSDKSYARYVSQYTKFIKWRETQNTESFSEDVLLAYFGEMSKQFAPTTLWSMYSMLKTTINCNHNVNIAEYARLIAFLKEKNNGFQRKKSSVFTSEELKKFLMEAADEVYLAIKTVMVFSIFGTCHGDELANIKVDDVKDNGSEIHVRIPGTKTQVQKVFTISGVFTDIVRKYINLRPLGMMTDRFFIGFQGGKCNMQLIGKNTISQMPKKIAEFLELPEPIRYTGHSLRSYKVLVDMGIDPIKRQGVSNPVVKETSHRTSHHHRDQIDPTKFDRVCRLCLKCVSETNNLFSIFDNETVSEGFGQHLKQYNDSVPKIIETCIGIKVDSTDRLPTGICSKCENSLMVANTFRHKCLVANDYLQQFKITADDEFNDTQDDTSNSFDGNPDITIDEIKIETPEEITDMDSESEFSLKNLIWNSNELQNSSSSSIALTHPTNKSSFSESKQKNESGCEKRMCIICGNILKRIREHISKPQLMKSDRIHHIDFHSNRDSRTLSNAEGDTADFLMCRMYHEDNREYVKVEIFNSDYASCNDFVKAASDRFTFNIDSFDHFVDQDGFRINNIDLINVYENFGSQCTFALGVILRKDGEIFNATTSNVCSQNIVSQLNTCTSKAITTSDFKDYLIKSDGAHILQEYGEKGMLSDTSRTFLINVAVDCLEEHFGIYPTKFHTEAMAHAIVELFPIYRTKYSAIGGIDLFSNGRTGYLDCKLKNLQSKRSLAEDTDASIVKKSKAIADEHMEILIEDNVFIKEENITNA